MPPLPLWLCSCSSSAAFFMHPSQAELLFRLPHILPVQQQRRVLPSQCLIYYGACRNPPRSRAGTKELRSCAPSPVVKTNPGCNPNQQAPDGWGNPPAAIKVTYLSSGHLPMQIGSLFDVSPTSDPFTHYYRKLTLLPIHGRSRT